MLSDASNPIKRTYTFEYWYIVYFHDIQLWESKYRTGDASADARVYSNLVATTRYMAHSSSLGATMSSSANNGNNDAQVIEVINRIVDLCKVIIVSHHWSQLHQVTGLNVNRTFGSCWTTTA